jgi:hypothetical protein
MLVKFPRTAELMASAQEDLLTFRHFPHSHSRKLWSTILLDRFNEVINRRTRVVGIFRNDVVIVRLVGAVMLVQEVHWQLGAVACSLWTPWQPFQPQLRNFPPWNHRLQPFSEPRPDYTLSNDPRAHDLIRHRPKIIVEFRGDSSPQ